MLFQKEEFIERIKFAISQDTPLTLVVGSPISFDYSRKKGVADVAATISSIRNAFSGDTAALEKLDAVLSNPNSNSYQNAFEYLLSVRGVKYANEIIQKSVLNAYEGSTGTLPGDVEISDEKWYLPPAADALGKLLAAKPSLFGNRILTTNFDPLIEVAIRRNGGSCYSTFFHRDGNPGATNAQGVNVIHLHGFWQGSDTLHTPHQLKQNRTQLKSYLLDLFRRTLVVVLAYGGWDDVVGSAIEDVVLEDNSDPELLWAFKSAELTHLEISEPRLMNRLAPGLSRGRVQLYGGVDCHEVLPMLYDGILAEKTRQDEPLRPFSSRRVLSEQEKILASVVGVQNERRVDTTPRLDGFVGRSVEINALASIDASVICITGFGGQGKSILAAKFLASFDDRTVKDWRDCREEGNTAHTALSLFLERISDGAVQADSLASASHRDLVELIIRHGLDKKIVLVLDNIDTYIDLDQQRPIGVIGVLCDRLLEVDTGIRLVLTCRPSVQIPNSHFFGLPLVGLDEKSVRLLFANRSADYQISDGECSSLMHLTEGHPLYLSMLAAQRLSTGKPLTTILSEVESARSDVPAMILRSTYKLLKPEQMEVIRLLAELERPEHEAALEEVTGQRYNRLSKSLKRLKDLSLILERRDMSDKTLIDLHPLVRQFLRREYPKKDRDSFIGRIIIYFDRRLALVAKKLENGNFPKNVLDVWTHKIEVLCNHANWASAIAELHKIENELGRSGLGEEYARLGVKIFSGVDWLSAIDESKEFRKLINGVCHELSHHKDHDEVSRWAEHYENAIGTRGADRLNILEFTAFDAWLQGDYSKALGLAREAVSLSTQIDISLPNSPEQTLGLILRDSGDIDGALVIFLEGLALEEALEENNGKSSEFFGNIGRCLYFNGDVENALRFYKRSGQEMISNPRSNHNTGWLRLWVGEALCKLGRVAEGYAFLCAAKHVWARGSKLLEMSADAMISEVQQSHADIDEALIPEWKVEKMFGAWVAKA